MGSRVALLGVLAAVGLLVVVGGALGAAVVLEEPTVEDVDVRWGSVDDETSEVRATVVVENPNGVGVPGVVDLEYTATLNDVVVAQGRQPGIELAPGTNRLTVPIEIRHDRIDDWWVTHVNGGEESTLTIEPAVAGPFGLGPSLPAQSQPVATDFLGSFDRATSTTLEVEGEPFLRIGERSARWGEATTEATPLELSATLTNLHDRPIVIDGFGYVVTMNDVTLGEGEGTDGLEVAPGATETAALTATLETSRIPDWWVSHLERDEVTDLTVTVYGLVETADGEQVAIPLIEQSVAIETDLLGGGDVAVQPAESDAAVAIEPPLVTGTSLGWGPVTEATTEVEARVGIDNPNEDPALAEVVTLVVDHSVVINGVTVADDTSTVGTLPVGEGEVALTAELDNAKVPEWWARHLNNGERSTVSFRADGRADAGLTTFPLEVPTRQQAFETDLLAGLRQDEPQPVTVGGYRVMTVVSTDASWAEASPATAPVDVAAEVRNDGFSDVTIRDVSYEVAINGVTLADDTAPGSWTVSPGETETVAFTMTLDNTRMAEWWVTHVRNDETSTLTVDVYVTVESGGTSERVHLDALGGNRTVETDILGAG